MSHSLPQPRQKKSVPRLDLSVSSLGPSGQYSSASTTTAAAAVPVSMGQHPASSLQADLSRPPLAASSTHSSRDNLSLYSSANASMEDLAQQSGQLAQDATTDRPTARRARPKPINMLQVSMVKQQVSIENNNSQQQQQQVQDQPLSVNNGNTSTSMDVDSGVIADPLASIHDFKLDLQEEQMETLEELGMGAGGTVFRVRHRASGLVMAKKMIHLLDAKISREILKELQILNKCNSVDIVSLYGAYQFQGQICICMEYMDVGSLEKIANIAGSRIAEEYLIKISVSVLKGLVYLFEKHRIIHRDIKPSNILVNSRGHVKICDFGVSGFLENTLANTFVGTGAYMSPERIQGGRYSVQCDVWSLGLTLLELGLGRYPFHQPGVDAAEQQLSIFELLTHIINETLPQLPKEQYSDLFRQFLNLCLCKNPKDRPTPSWLLNNHPIIAHSEKLKVDMVAWACRFTENQLNPKQMQRWSITREHKRQSWLNVMEKRRSGIVRNLDSGIASGNMRSDKLPDIPGSPPVTRRR